MEIRHSPLIALSHGGTTTYATASHAQRLLVATAGGVAILERQRSGDWSEIDRILEGRHVSAIITPRPGLLAAGVFHDAVYVSEDGGKTWDRRGDGIEPSHVYSLASVERDA